MARVLKHISNFSHLNLIVFGLSSLLLTVFLFYIDEGYYSMRWMLAIENWIPFLGYCAGFLIGLSIAHDIIRNIVPGHFAYLFTYMVGLPLGFVLSLGLILFLGVFYFSLCAFL